MEVDLIECTIVSLANSYFTRAEILATERKCLKTVSLNNMQKTQSNSESKG